METDFVNGHTRETDDDVVVYLQIFLFAYKYTFYIKNAMKVGNMLDLLLICSQVQ